VEPSKSVVSSRAYKHVLLVVLSLFPFGISATAAFAAWELSEGLDPIPRLVFAVIMWVVAFAAGTQVLWRIAEALAPQ